MAKGIKLNKILKNPIKIQDVKEKVDYLSNKKIVGPDIQVMMLGARRVGKTSVLASMVNQFNNVTANTNLVLTKGSGGTEIDKAYVSMNNYFVGEPKAYEMVGSMDNNPTSGFDYFDLKLSIANKKEVKPRKIRFKDCAGEWITNYSNTSEIAEEIEKSDVVIIAIDSVLLMEEKGKFNHQNAVQNVTNFIKENMNPADNVNNHKMVLFVPLKCEKYYWQHLDKNSRFYNKRMESLNKAIKEAYADLLAFLAKPNNKPHFDVAILPIITIGGIEFYEFKETQNPNEILTGEIMYAFSKEPKFAPRYCDMPLIYTLLFEYNKIQNEYKFKTYTKDNKKKITATIWEWLQDKQNLAKDADYLAEMKEIRNIFVQKKNEVPGFEVIQGQLL